MIKVNLDQLVYKIKTSKLIGEKAHREMSPINRSISVNSLKDEKVRKAAVLIMLHEEDGTIYFPLIERHVYEGNHSREIGLPGGKIEESDINLAEAVLRENEEELGVRQSEVKLIKELTQIFIPPSNFMVTPYVGFLNSQPSYIPDPIEVKTIIKISIDQLLENSNITNIIKHNESFKNEIPVFKIDDNIIWGATACILNELKYLLKNY